MITFKIFLFTSSYPLVTGRERFILQRPHQKRVGIFVTVAKHSTVGYKGVSTELSAHDKKWSQQKHIHNSYMCNYKKKNRNLRKLPRDGSDGQEPKSNNLNINYIWVPGMRFWQLRTKSMKTVLRILFFLSSRDWRCS